MNELYAVDPGSFESPRVLKLLLDQFGFSTGRFIADFPNDWSRDVKEKLNSCTDIDRKILVDSILRAERGALVPLTAPYRRTLSWVENAVGAKKAKAPIERIIAGKKWPPLVESLDDVLYQDDHRLPDGVGGLIPRTIESYLAVTRPLLRSSSLVVLADRFFRLRHNGRRSRNARVLSALLQAANNVKRGGVFKLILLRSEALANYRSEGEFEDDLTGILGESGASNMEIEYVLNESMEHGRYIFARDGGLQFDHGFDIDSAGQVSRNHVHWLSPAQLDAVWQQYR